MRQLILMLALGAASLAGAAPATQPTIGQRDLEGLRERADMLQSKLEVLNQHKQDLANRIEEDRQQIRAASGRLAVTPEGIRAALSKLQEQRDQLELDEAGDAGRRAGIEQAIDKLTTEAAKKAQSDEVVEQLAKVAAIRDRQVERLEQMQKSHAVSQGDVEAAEAEAAMAHAKLAEARQRAIGAGAREALDGWNRELLKLSIDEQERKARLKFIAERLSGASSMDNLLDDLEQRQSALSRLAAETEQVSRASQSARESYDYYKDRGNQTQSPSGNER